MKNIDQWTMLQAKSIFNDAAEINEKTNYCVDIQLIGVSNSIEVRIYESKDVTDAILNESFNLQGDDTSEHIDIIEEKLSEIKKTIK